MTDFIIAPDPSLPRLTRAVAGIDHTGAAVDLRVVEERPLTIFLNAQEIVTAMTIGDYPEELGIGYLLNQGMLRRDDVLTGVEYDDDLEVLVVRTERATDYEEKLKKKTRTSGCAVGTVFGDMMETLEGLTLPPAEIRTSWLYALAKRINTVPSLYLEAGAIHGTVLCRGDRPLVHMDAYALHDRAVDLGNGDQDGEHGHSGARLPLRLYGVGGRDRARGGADPDRANAGAAVRMPVRGRAAGDGCGPRDGRGRGGETSAQGRQVGPARILCPGQRPGASPNIAHSRNNVLWPIEIPGLRRGWGRSIGGRVQRAIRRPTLEMRDWITRLRGR